MAHGADSYLIRCPACSTANRVPASSEGRAGKCGNCHQPLPPLHTQPVELTDADFGRFMDRHRGLVLAEFWAPW